MANAVAVRDYGDQYQALVFWKYALDLLKKDSDIENIGYEDPDCYDENCRYIGKGPVGYYELLEVISDVARRLIEEDYFLQRCGKRIPIIIQDLEFTWYVLEATKKVNIHDEAHDFFKALESGNM